MLPQERFEPFFLSHDEWSGRIAVAPTESELLDALLTRDVYVYMVGR